MLSTIKTYLANQARKPSGWFGKFVAPVVYNHENKDMEDFGLEIMDPPKDDNILEIGFGHGGLISDLMPRIADGKVCGIDLSEEMAQVAANRNKEWIGRGQLELKQASIASIPYPDNHFDKIFTCNTIYFWPNPSKNLKEVKRALKPNGQFFCVFRDKDLMESKGSAVTDNREVFQNLYHKDEVIRLFEDVGFRQVTHHQETKNSEEIHLVNGSK